MTKFPLTEAFLKVVEDTARRHRADKIIGIWICAGKGMLFKKNTAAYLEYLLRGTAARDAEIYIRYAPTANRCRSCELIFSNSMGTECPECKGVGDSISLEKRFIIDRIQME